MPPTHRLAALQHSPTLSPAHNFTAASALIRRAAAQRATLAVLPEYSLTGWSPATPNFLSTATAAHTTYLPRFCALAKELSVSVVPGTLLEAVDDKIYNVAYFIGSDGEIKGRYRKKNLWHPEREHLEASGVDERHDVIETELGKVGLLICWDLAFPEAFRELVLAGAKIIIVPTFWTMNDITPQGMAHNPESEALFLRSTLVSRAFENTCCVVFANAGGAREKGYAGLSSVVVPFKGMIAEAEGTQEQVVVADVDMQILEDAEECYGIRRDLSSEGFHYRWSKI